MLLALAASAGAVMVSYSTAKAEALGVDPPRGLMRRQERAVYLVLGAALTPFFEVATRRGLPVWAGQLPLLAALAMIALFGNASAVRRLKAVSDALRRQASPACEQTEPMTRDVHAAAGDAIR